MLSRAVGLVLGAAMFAVLGVATSDSAEVAVVRSGEFALARPFAIAPAIMSCGHCEDCLDRGMVGHEFEEEDPSPRDGYEHICFGNVDCTSDYHPACGTGSEDLSPVLAKLQGTLDTPALLWVATAAAAGDVESLSLALERGGGRARINLNRRALQIASECSPDYIIAQVPLSEAQLESLAEASSGGAPR